MIILLLLPILSGCTKYEALTTHVVGGYFVDGSYVSPMNTNVSLRMFNKDQYNEVVKEYDNNVINLSKQVDRYHDYENMNNLKTINDSCGTGSKVIVSDELFEVINLGIEITKLSKGSFNIAMGNLIDLYDFDEDSAGSYKQMPSKEIIDEAVNSIPKYDEIENYIKLDKNDNSIILEKYNGLDIKISVGAIAKGYVMDKAISIIKDKSYPAISDAGSSTMALIGKKPLGNKTWSLSFREPLINNPTVALCTLTSSNSLYISSSGDSIQNFFYIDDLGNSKLMHHIIDPYTGISNSYYRNVSIVSNDAPLYLLDAITTAIFNIKEYYKAISFIDLVSNTYDVELDYILVKPFYNNNEIDYTKFDVIVSEDFDKMVNGNYSTDIISKEVIYDN